MLTSISEATAKRFKSRNEIYNTIEEAEREAALSRAAGYNRVAVTFQMWNTKTNSWVQIGYGSIDPKSYITYDETTGR